MAKYDIFISYRRTGGFELAEVLYSRLTAQGYKVFLDIESLRSGKFNEALLQCIDECNDILLILPPNALDRCVNPDDWVRREITWAIERGKKIIPIYMNGFSMPDELPVGMEELPAYNAIIASSKTFDQTLAEITSFLTSQSVVQTNTVFRNTASSINRNILAWRIPFFPLLAYMLFEICMIIPFEPLRISKLYINESNFALCRMIYLILSSTLIGCVLWGIPRIIKNRFGRFFSSVIAMILSCLFATIIVDVFVWDGLYDIWNTALGVTLLITPWIVTWSMILLTFFVKLFFVYVFEIK